MIAAAKSELFSPFKYLLDTFIVLAGAVLLAGVCAAQSPVSRKDTQVSQADGLVAEGLRLFERNDIAAAQNFFQKAIEADPKNVAAHTYLGIIADRAGESVRSERHFSAAVLADPLSPSAHNNHGAILLKLGRTKEAAAEFEASLHLNKQQVSASINLAQIRLSSGTPADLRQARELLARAYAIAPDVELARALTIVALRIEDRQSAANYFREYWARLASAGGPPIPAATRAELGTALLENGLTSEAVDELKAALATDPSNPETVLQLAKAYLALGDIPSSGRTLEGAVARGLETGPIYALLASVYEKSGRPENAIPAMRLAIQRDPQSESYRFKYGMLLTSALAPDAAVIRLKESLELFPQSARLWFALGIAQFKTGRNDEAAKSLLRAIEIDPKFAPAFAYLGMTYVEIGQYDEAIKAYQQALAVNEKLGVVDFLLADVLLKQTSADRARIEDHLMRAVKLEPSFVPARLALGKLYLRNGHLSQAAIELEQVIKLDPNLAEAYYQLGIVYTRLKRTAEAKAMFGAFKGLSDTQKEQALKDRKEIVRRLANVFF
jgi:Tfp pilus assembly protein PilF